MLNCQVLIEKLLQIKQNYYIENQFKKLEIFYSIYFRGKSHFEDDGTQNCLVFQAVSKYFKTVSTSHSNILSGKSKGLSDGSIKPLSSGKVKHELRVTSSNSRVTSSNSRVTSSNSRVRRLKARVARLKARVTRLKARLGRLKERVEAIKPRVK